MNSQLLAIDSTNAINVELLEVLKPTPLTAEEEEKQKEYFYSRYLKHLGYMKNWKNKNLEKYNETQKLAMRENYKNKPQYAEKQLLRYYKKTYGVETKEEAMIIKEERKQAKVKEVIEKYDKEDKLKPPGIRKHMDYETFVKTKIIVQN